MILYIRLELGTVMNVKTSFSNDYALQAFLKHVLIVEEFDKQQKS